MLQGSTGCASPCHHTPWCFLPDSTRAAPSGRPFFWAVARLAEGQAVAAVAYDLGYDSPSAFIAMFRRSLGATPGHYLKPAGRSAQQGISNAGPAG